MKPIYALISNKLSCFGIIRISFGNYGYIVKKVVKKITKLRYVFPRYAHKVCIYIDDKKIDDGILIYYPEPNSYTGESFIEIYLHNNYDCLKHILNYIKNSFKNIEIKKSKVGEFTYRSFINGKLNIFDVEKIHNTINSSKKIDILGFYKKNILKKKKFLFVKKKIDNLIINIENSLFNENKKEEEEKKIIKRKIKNIINYIDDINFSTYNKVKVLIVGKPNVGKSEIFNKIIEKKRSIVYNKKGTTRNIIRESIYFNEFEIEIFDTIGINLNSKNKIEILGIKKTIREIKKSNILINVQEKRSDFFKKSNKKVINVINKIDKIKKKKRMNTLYISAKYNIGIENLKKVIIKEAYKKYKNKNYYNIFKNKKEKEYFINKIFFFFFKKEYLLLINQLKELKIKIGFLKEEDLLKKVLKNFCIGK
ncbi:GTPase [Candidatus Vidania fulgoroideorum]